MTFTLTGEIITQTGNENNLDGAENLNAVFANAGVFNAILRQLHINGNLVINKDLVLKRLQLNSTGTDRAYIGSNDADGNFENFISIYIDDTWDNQWSDDNAGLGILGFFEMNNVKVRFGPNVAPGGQTGIMGGWQQTGAGDGNNRIFRNVYFQMDNAGNGGHIFYPESILENVHHNGIDFIFFEANPISATGIQVANSNWGLVFSDKTEVELKKGTTTRITNQGNSGGVLGFWKLVDFQILESMKWRQNSNAGAGYRFFKTFKPILAGDNKEEIKIRIFDKDENELAEFITDENGEDTEQEIKWIEFTRGGYGKSNSDAFNPNQNTGTLEVSDFNNDIQSGDINNKVISYELPIKIQGISYTTKPFIQNITSFDISQEEYKNDYDIVSVPIYDDAITETDKSVVGAYTGFDLDHTDKTITITENRNLNQLYDYIKYHYVEIEDTKPSIDEFLIHREGTTLNIKDYNLDLINGSLNKFQGKFDKIISTGFLITETVIYTNVSFLFGNKANCFLNEITERCHLRIYSGGVEIYNDLNVQPGTYSICSDKSKELRVILENLHGIFDKTFTTDEWVNKTVNILPDIDALVSSMTQQEKDNLDNENALTFNENTDKFVYNGNITLTKKRLIYYVNKFALEHSTLNITDFYNRDETTFTFLKEITLPSETILNTTPMFSEWNSIILPSTQDKTNLELLGVPIKVGNEVLIKVENLNPENIVRENNYRHNILIKKTTETTWNNVGFNFDETSPKDENSFWLETNTDYDIRIRQAGYKWIKFNRNSGTGITITPSLEAYKNNSNGNLYDKDKIIPNITFDIDTNKIKIENTTNNLLKISMVEAFSSFEKIVNGENLISSFENMPYPSGEEEYIIPDNNPLNIFLSEDSINNVILDFSIKEEGSKEFSYERFSGNSSGKQIIFRTDVNIVKFDGEIDANIKKVNGANITLQDFKADVSHLDNYDDTALINKINLIPTNTLLTTDTRLNNLDGKISEIKEFTDTDRTKLNSLDNYDDTSLTNKIDLIPLNSLLTNDTRLNNLDKKISEVQEFTNADRTKLNSLDNFDDTELENKIDLIPLNPLLTTDTRLNNLDKKISEIQEFTDVDRNKLDSLNNFDDTELKNLINGLNDLTAQEIWEYVERSLTNDINISQSQITEIAAEVESHLLDETDGKKILEAIVTAIGNQNINEVSLIAAIRADLERTGGKIDSIKLNSENTDIKNKLNSIDKGVSNASKIIPHNNSDDI